MTAPTATKPWEAALPGEVWALEVDGHSRFAMAGRGDFAHLFEFSADHSMSKVHSAITDGRRVWPEPTTDLIDPDCVEGKHKACPGWTWSSRQDRAVVCECACHEPGLGTSSEPASDLKSDPPNSSSPAVAEAEHGAEA